MAKCSQDRETYLANAAAYAARGQDLPQAKLMDLDVISIRQAKRKRDDMMKYIALHLSNESLSRQYGVSVRAIERILARETWTHLP